MSNLIAVAKLCFENLRSSIGLSSASLYDRIDQSKADEYSRHCYRAGPPKEVSIVTPRKRRKAENPVRPVKRLNVLAGMDYLDYWLRGGRWVSLQHAR